MLLLGQKLFINNMSTVESFLSIPLEQTTEPKVPEISLPVLDTYELLDEIGDKWELPSGEKSPRLIRTWLNFCNAAIKGNEIVSEAARTGIIALDHNAMDCMDLTSRSLGNSEEAMKKIRATQRAFGKLLGESKRSEEMQSEDPSQAREFVRRVGDLLLCEWDQYSLRWSHRPF